MHEEAVKGSAETIERDAVDQEKARGGVLGAAAKVLTFTSLGGAVALLGLKFYSEYKIASLSGPVVTTDESPPSAILNQGVEEQVNPLEPGIVSPQPPSSGRYDREVSPDFLPSAEEASQPEEVIPPTVYVVQSGDSLWKISQEFGTPVEIIRGMNPEIVGDNDLIHPGDELLIIYWGPVDQSYYLSQKKMEAAWEKGEELSWVHLPLDKKMSALELANFFGIDSQPLIELNEIENPEAILPEGYYLMIPIGEGFAFNEQDRESGRRWRPISGLSMDRIWWENPTGEVAGPWWPCEAKMMVPVRVEYWYADTWSSASYCPPDSCIVDFVTDIPEDTVVSVPQPDGTYQDEVRPGFRVYGKKKITHSEFEAALAGEWIVPTPQV